MLLFGAPTLEQVEQSLEAVMRPFPAGLWTPVGMLIANPAYASREMQERFTKDAYHGTVAWSWQHAVLAAGLDRQLRRADLPDGLRQRLSRARMLVWTAIDGAGDLRTSELWSWTFANGCYRPQPFGQSLVDESNAAQLWSTVYLALPPPAPFNTHRARGGQSCVPP
jgi:hypothetical protein